jgi:hypothetical protein
VLFLQKLLLFNSDCKKPQSSQQIYQKVGLKRGFCNLKKQKIEGISSNHEYLL